MPFPLIYTSCAQDGASVRTKAEDQHPPKRQTLLQETLLYKIPVLPVWEHTVITALSTHGFRDVTGHKSGFFHSVNKVSGGLQHGVVGHEVCGSDASVIAKDVNC